MSSSDRDANEASLKKRISGGVHISI